MRDSNTWIYLVAGVIILHFIVGFIYLIKKMTGGKNDDVNDRKADN